MESVVAPQSRADAAEYYEVRDLLSGESIGRISARRLQDNHALRVALEKNGFRLVAMRGQGTQDRLSTLADAA